jgi:hypothetical protein
MTVLMLDVASVTCFRCFAGILGVTECLWEEHKHVHMLAPVRLLPSDVVVILSTAV